MCIKCVLKALAEASMEAEAGAPGQTGNAADSLVDREYQAVELNHIKAQTNATNADAIHKLAQAVKWLSDSHYPEQALRVAGLIESLTPDTGKAEMFSGTAAAQPTEADDEFAGMPSSLKEYVLDMRSKGMDIEVRRLPL